MYGWLANAVVLVHLAFIVFVIVGGILALRWRRLAWLHLPTLAWGIYITLTHSVCPLTPLENHFRERAGQAGYSGAFMDQYIMPIVYPSGLTFEIQTGMGLALIIGNMIVYYIAWRRRSKV